MKYLENIFNKRRNISTESTKTEVIEVIEEGLTDSEIIQRIHNEFNTSGEKLLNEAKKVLEECKEHQTDKAKRMQALGFHNTEAVKNLKEATNKEYKALKFAQTVKYYSLHYPNNKFITKEEVEKICSKYNLVYGEVSLYKGDIPDKNLKEIENFNLREEDYLYSEITSFRGLDIGEEITKHTKESFLTAKSKYEISKSSSSRIYKRFSCTKGSLYIAAPESDMDTSGMKLDNFKLVREIPDPVVLQEVKDGFLIITAWGDEASDSLVVNQKFN